MEPQTVIGEMGLDTPERIIWGAWGLLSFVFLIVYLRWEGPREDELMRPPEASNHQQQRRNDSMSGRETSIRSP